MDRLIKRRIWISTAIAMPLSIASAFSYLGYMAQGIVVGALRGLPGRESDVSLAQHRALEWLLASVVFLTVSVVMTTFALPFYADASRLSRTTARFAMASILCLAMTVLIALVAFSIFTATGVSVVWARF
jgi:uncharacterized protein YacL